jgi:hypothetical protein
MRERVLQRGDEVEVRSAADILATLDDRGALDGLPFMPEMIQFCGRRFTVDRRAERLCDTITSNLSTRRLPDTVLLAQLRCDGSGHGGCEAECRLYWKEAWLRRVEPGDRPVAIDADDTADAALRARVAANTDNGATDADLRYRCQATELAAASERNAVTDVASYVREYRTGNVALGHFVRVMARAAWMQPLQKVGRLPLNPLAGPDGTSPNPPRLDLRPGEWVRVKTPEEIEATLTDTGRNRGLWFDREMLPFCGRVFQVRKRVTRIIDEPNGKMLTFDSDCIILDGVVCSGERSTGRWFCPREIPCYWRECWLERLEPSTPPR